MATTITTAICTSFKVEILGGTHNINNGGNALKMALISPTGTGTYNAATTNAGTPGTGTPTTANLGTDEVTGTGYTAGGAALTNQAVAFSGTTAYWTPSANPSWTSATFSASGALNYNTTQTNRSISCHSFGGTQSVSSGTFTVLMPTNAAGTALLQLN